MSVQPDTIIIITPPPASKASVAQNSQQLSDHDIAKCLRELADALHPQKEE